MPIARWFSALPVRARSFLRRRTIDAELEAELRDHVERATAEFMRHGLPPDEARRRALVSLGGVERRKEEMRAARATHWLETVAQDVRHGGRLLARLPGFTAAAVIALGLAIGATSAIYSVVRAVVLRPLPYAHPDGLVVILEKGKNPVSPANFFDWKRDTRSFSAMGAAEDWSISLSGSDQPEKIQALRLTSDVLPMLGVPPFLGRAWTPAEDAPGANRVVVLSYGLWMRHFGGDDHIIGRPIRLDGIPFTVVGVMPPQFSFAPFWETRAELWAPLVLAPRMNERGGSLRIFARLRDGVGIGQARDDVAAVTARIEEQFPGTNRNIEVTDLTEKTVGAVRTPLFVLLVAVGCVLLIACTDVAHLLLARAATRRREIALRSALGADRGRVVRQLLTESALLALIGGSLGLALAQLIVHLVASLGAAGIPRVGSVALDSRVLAFTLLVTLATVLVFGLVPALRSSRQDLATSIRDGERGTAARTRDRTRTLLIGSQFTLAFVLLVGAGLLIRSFAAMQALDPGFDPHNVLTFVLPVTGTAESPADRRAAFYEDVLRRVRALPGVQSVSAVNHIPIGGDSWGWPFRVEGRPAPAPGESPVASFKVVLPGYFEAMRIPLLDGRDVSGSDRVGAPAVVVVNDFLARRYWPGRTAIGERISLGADSLGRREWTTVVGVVHNTIHDDWSSPPEEEVFLPFLQNRDYLANPSTHFAYMSFVVRLSCPRARCDAASVAPSVRSIVRSLDPNVPLADVRTMDDVVRSATARERFYLSLLVGFATLALVLAVVGIYGVVSYEVSQRTHEMGLRLALGASASALRRRIVREGMTVALAGGVVGLAGAVALGRALSAILFRVHTTDPVTFAGAFVVLGAAAALGCMVPAHRATRVDPMTALRQE